MTNIIVAFYDTTLKMAPWLLFGFLMAGMLSLFFTPEVVNRHLGKKAGKRAIALAVLLGVPLPLCSCGVLPVAVGMRKGGASKGATAAFLISTPQTGIDSFFATGSLLGWVFAITRPLVAFVSGLIGGALVDAFDKEPPLTYIPSQETNALTKGPWIQRLIAALKYGYITLLGNVSIALIWGLIISALIVVFVPDDFFGGIIPASDWLVFPLMLLIGIPMYVCSTASIPVALALMAKGISPGAALIFLIVGPALNGASIMTLLKLLGKTCTLIHLGIIAIGAMLAGVGLNILNTTWELLPDYANAETCCHPETTLTSILSHLCAIALLALLVLHRIRAKIQKHKPCECSCSHEANHPKAHIVTVQGMRCAHCRAAVQSLLEKYPSVTAATSISNETFEVVGDLPSTLEKDIADLGFKLIASKRSKT